MDPSRATDSYLSLALALPHLEPYTLLSALFLTLARLLPLMVITPFFGGKNLPAPIRMMFSLSLVALFLPQNLLTLSGNIPFGVPWIGLMLKEFLMGFVLAFLSSVPFFLVQMSGTFIDHSRGSSALQVTDPTTQSQTGPIGILFNYVLLAIFYSLGGPFIFFEGIAQSYTLMPIDQFLNPAVLSASAPYWQRTSTLLGMIFDLSIRIAAPALIGILLTDLFLGIANRLAPQVQIVFLGISLKSWVGIALLTASWGLVIQVMGKESIAWFKAINQLIQKIGWV
jgi:type III secretion protein T